LGGALRIVGIVAAALVCASPAFARTDGPRQVDLAWPANGTLTSPFGYDGGRWHPGLDIGTLRSLDVRAAAPGVVTKVGYVTGYEGYGLIVEADLGHGFTALYAHLSRASVHPWQYISAGEPLGVAGCTGWCTGTHLHFEVRHAGRPIDPRPLLRLG
jgi:murein DD-endopeptidase MepM/ murein hydrolase activator NlpD